MSLDIHFNEKELLHQLSSGNERAFTILFDKYKNILYGSALKTTKSKTLSEEVVQDVFLKIWLRRDEMKYITDFESYLFVSGRNHIFNNIKKIAKENTLKNKNVDISFDSAYYFLEDEQYNILLNKILLKLPAQQQKIYQMAKVDELSHEKIAKILNISPLTVKKHMSQALKFIRIQLESHINLILFLFF